MDEPQKTENRGALATLAAAISFPYIWLGLYLILALMYGTNFLGRGLGGGLIASLMCLALLNPVVPGVLSTLVARPIFSNILAREIVTGSGCLVGLGAVVLVGLVSVYFLSRNLTVALLVFLAAPVVSGGFALIATGISRSGRGARPHVRAEPSGPIRITKPDRPSLPGRSDHPSLPGSSTGTGSRLPPPRRTETPNTASKGRIPPPPRVRK